MKVDDSFNIKHRGLVILVKDPEVVPIVGQVWMHGDVEWMIIGNEHFKKCLCGVSQHHNIYGLCVRTSVEGKTLVRDNELTLKDSK